MTKLTIQHEWKNYKWKGDKWGHDTIKAFKIEKLHFMDWVYTVDVSRRNTNWELCSRERVHAKKCILRDTEWEIVKKPARFLYAYRKSNFKGKEILPLDRLDYVWAKEYLVIY